MHLTLLSPDSGGKAGTERDKIMVGPSNGWPVVLAPINDLLGLIICEGIESGLTLHEATGCGVWAAGSSSRLPALADAVPPYFSALQGRYAALSWSLWTWRTSKRLRKASW